MFFGCFPNQQFVSPPEDRSQEQEAVLLQARGLQAEVLEAADVEGSLHVAQSGTETTSGKAVFGNRRRFV